MNAKTSTYVNIQRKPKLKVHSLFQSEYNPNNEIKTKIKKEKQKINDNIIENIKMKKENEQILEERNSCIRKKQEELNDIYKLIKDKNKNEIGNKDINKTILNINECCDTKKSTPKKSEIRLESDFDINLKIYKRSNIKINNTKNICIINNKILIICFIIIKYLFISNISCNNKGLFKLNDSIIKLELKVTKKQKYQIFYKTFMNNNKKK